MPRHRPAWGEPPRRPTRDRIRFDNPNGRATYVHGRRMFRCDSWRIGDAPLGVTEELTVRRGFGSQRFFICPGCQAPRRFLYRSTGPWPEFFRSRSLMVSVQRLAGGRSVSQCVRTFSIFCVMCSTLGRRGWNDRRSNHDFATLWRSTRRSVTVILMTLTMRLLRRWARASHTYELWSVVMLFRQSSR